MTLKDLHQRFGYNDDRYHKIDVIEKKIDRDLKKKEKKILETL